jgi:hypothetical protein
MDMAGFKCEIDLFKQKGARLSVSKWMVAAGATVKSDAKIERCAKVTGEVVYTVTLALNEFFDGKWTPPVWKPSKKVEHCVSCHGPDLPNQKAAD